MENKVSVCLLELQNTKGDKYALDVAKKIGADAIDLDLFMHSVQNESDVYARGTAAVVEYFTDIKSYADSLGIAINQTHGRLIGFGVTPEGDDVFIKNSELDLIASRILGAKYCVVHTPAYNHVGGDRTDEEMFDIATRLFSGILPFAKREDVRIAAETHGDASKFKKMEFFGYIHNLSELCERLRRDYAAGEYICVCVDTGHTNLAVKYEGNPSVGDAIRQLGGLVKVLHLHDNNGMKDQHKIPMTGDLDWADILCALDEIGFDGYYNLENMMDHFGEGFDVEEADFSVKVMRHMLASHGRKAP